MKKRQQNEGTKDKKKKIEEFIEFPQNNKTHWINKNNNERYENEKLFNNTRRV